MKRFFASTKTSLAACGLFALMLAVTMAGGSASAHAKLTSSTPADGSTVAPGLTTVSMTFGEEASVTKSTAQLLQADGTAMAGVSSAVDKADRTKMSITTPALGAGKYMVKWHTITEDDNGIADGTFAFTVAAGGGAATSGSSSNAGAEQTMPATGGEQFVPFMGAMALVALATASTGVRLRRQDSR